MESMIGERRHLPTDCLVRDRRRKRCVTRIACAFGAALCCSPALHAVPCDNIPNLDHPHVLLASGGFRAVVFLPDTANGYYRAARFDWSGVIGCASYQGHTYWGQWFTHYDPQINDSVTGPVEEFRPADGAQGYDAAKAGGLFVKIGVGLLRKVSDTPYNFGFAYPIVDTGHWKVHARHRSIVFEQTLKSSTGVRYRYRKILSVNRDGSVLTLRHELKNLASAPLITDVYDHDFFMLDSQPTGPGFSVRLAFAPTLQDSLAPYAALKGNSVVYEKKLAPRETAASYITGYGSGASDFPIIVADSGTGAAVEQTADRPIERFYLWSIRTTVAPEAYLHIEVPGGGTQSWTIRYRFQPGDAH